MGHPDSEDRSASTRSRRRSGWRLSLLVFSVVLFGVAVWRAGPKTIFVELSHVGFARALWLLLPYALGTAVGALPWMALLPRAVRPSLRGVLLGRFVASSANALLPLFGLAGEPARLLWLDRRARAQGVAAMVVDRVLYNTSNGVLLLAGSVTAFTATKLPRGLSLLGMAAAIVMFVVTIGALVLIVRYGVGGYVQGLVHRIAGPLAATEGFGNAVDEALVTLVRGNKRWLAALGLVHLVARALILVEVYVGLLLLREPFTVAEAVVFAVVPIGLGLVFSAIPSEIGVHEGGLALIASALGHRPALGVTLVLLQRFRQLVFAAFIPPALRAVPARDSRAEPSHPPLTPARGSPPRPSPFRRTS